MNHNIEDRGIKIRGVEPAIFGFIIQWVDNDGWFGECNFSCNEEGIWEIDAECMVGKDDKEFLSKLLDLLKEYILVNSVIVG